MINTNKTLTTKCELVQTSSNSLINKFLLIITKLSKSVNSVYGLQCKSMGTSVFTHADSICVLGKLILAQKTYILVL